MHVDIKSGNVIQTKTCLKIEFLFFLTPWPTCAPTGTILPIIFEAHLSSKAFYQLSLRLTQVVRHFTNCPGSLKW